MAADDPGGDASRARPERVNKFWAELLIDPIEIALPGGVGYTLRAYRPSAQIARPAGRGAAVEMDDFDAAAASVIRRRARAGDSEGASQRSEERIERGAGQWGSAGDDEDGAQAESEEPEESEDSEEPEESEEDDLAGVDEETSEEDAPVFLGGGGRLYLFHSPRELAKFVRSGPHNDLSQIDTWPDLVKRVREVDIVALDDDTYELDLVVENLRGGPDAWDPALILRAGEIARDIGYAFGVDSIQVALAPGSPLDDLDEALRAVDAGGMGGFLARRRLRKIPAQQSSLAWRTIIGRISALAQWHD